MYTYHLRLLFLAFTYIFENALQCKAINSVSKFLHINVSPYSLNFVVLLHPAGGGVRSSAKMNSYQRSLTSVIEVLLTSVALEG
jgi:hypothetical protein